MSERNVKELRVNFAVLFDGDEMTKDEFIQSFDKFVAQVGQAGYVIPCASISPVKDED